jgi:hypothetical protein
MYPVGKWSLVPSVCNVAGITSPKIVWDFVDAVRTMELLPVAWIPVMEVRSRMLTPSPTQSKVVPKRLVPCVKKATSPPEDVHMSEVSDD